MATTANTVEISAAGREAAEGADSIIRARVDQLMAERVGAQIGRTDIKARVAQECGRIIISWTGPVVKWDTYEDVAALRRAEAQCAALTEALEAVGYEVTGNDTTHSFTSWTEVRRGAAVAVAVKA